MKNVDFEGLNNLLKGVSDLKLWPLCRPQPSAESNAYVQFYIKYLRISNQSNPLYKE